MFGRTKSRKPPQADAQNVDTVAPTRIFQSQLHQLPQDSIPLSGLEIPNDCERVCRALATFLEPALGDLSNGVVRREETNEQSCQIPRRTALLDTLRGEASHRGVRRAQTSDQHFGIACAFKHEEFAQCLPRA